MIAGLKKRPITSLLITLFIILAGSLSGWLPVDRAGRWVIKPIASILVDSGKFIGSWFSEIGQIGQLRQANEGLSEQNQQLEQQLVQISGAEQENQQLREQLNFQNQTKFSAVGAEIINYQPDSLRQFVRINCGQDDGIKPGQPVVAAGKLVGSITKVDGATSEVILISDSEARVLGKSLNGAATGVIKGRPPEGLVMDRIPRDKPLKVGDLIVSSGLDGQFPPGIVIGQVIDVQASAEAIFQTAQLKPAIALADLRLVSVLKY